MDTKDDIVHWCSRQIADKIARKELTLRATNNQSRVWSIFAKINDRNGHEIIGYVCCRICKKVFRFSKSSATSNLVKHKCYILKYIHRAKSSTSIAKSEMPSTRLEYNIDDIDNLTKIMTRCIIKSCRSYELLQDDDFKAIFQEFVALGAKFGTGIDVGKFLPGTKAISRNVYEMYGNCFNRVHAEIEAIKRNGFGLAIHVWTNNCLNKNYVALTIHFVNHRTIRCRFLGLRPVEGEQCTTRNISDEVKHILEDYDCELSSTSIIVTSGCSDVMASQTIPCISGLLNTALQKSADEVPAVTELINSCIKLISILNREEIQIFPEQRLCPSRWKFLYKVLNLMATHWEEIESALELKNEEAHTKNINIDHLKALVKTIEPFEEALASLEKQSKPTLHLVLVYLHDLKKSCESNDKDEYEFIVILKEILRFQLDKITTENIKMFHKLALFLYPPTKKLLQFNDKEKQRIETECTGLMKSFDYDLKPKIKQEADFKCNSVSKRRKLFSDFLDCETENDPNEFIIQEIQIYKMSRVVYSEDFDLFGWWEQQKDNFPLLYKLSCLVFAIPATSISAQKIFTSTRGLLCDKTFGIDTNDMNIDQIAFLKFNAEQDELDQSTSNQVPPLAKLSM